MLIMAVSGAAVLALVCWAALRENAPDPFAEPGSARHTVGRLRRSSSFIPQTTPDRHVDEGEDGDGEARPSRPLAGAVTANADGVPNTTFADADTDQALAAAAALWNVMDQDQE